MNVPILSNNPKSPEEMRWNSEKCVRCNMCKFPPLARVESHAHSMGCPSYEEFKFNSSSGGGMVIMANSLLARRSAITEEVRDVVYGCTLCGLCDVSCKFNTDLEVLDILLLLRHKLFAEGAIHEAHRRVLSHVRTHGHPLVGLGSTPQVDTKRSTTSAPTLVWVGPHFSYDPARRGWLEQQLDLLDRAGVRYQLLGEREPYTGRAALEIGDRELFRNLSRDVAAAIQKSGVSRIITLAAEDYSTLRSQTPRFAKVPVPVEHISETYAALLSRRALRPARTLDGARTAWHDPCYLGRLGGLYRPWTGTEVKVGGIKVYDPPRPIDYGSGGLFEEPRRVLSDMCEGALVELPRRREYAWNAGETGQAAAVAPELVANTARIRIEEARACGVTTLVTECPQAEATLRAAARDVEGVLVRTLTDLLTRSIEGGLS